MVSGRTKAEAIDASIAVLYEATDWISDGIGLLTSAIGGGIPTEAADTVANLVTLAALRGLGYAYEKAGWLSDEELLRRRKGYALAALGEAGQILPGTGVFPSYVVGVGYTYHPKIWEIVKKYVPGSATD